MNDRREPRETDPPFRIRELAAVLPRDALAPSTTRSLAHLVGDLAGLGALYSLALWLESPLWWPVLWLFQGTLLWALFVIGHDCGHGSFSRHPRLNDFVGHLTHTPLLVPFHPWRASHRAHHRHTGDLDHDEAWAPLTSDQLQELSRCALALRLRLPLLVFPFYLMRGTPRRGGSHFDPRASFIPPEERGKAWSSILLCAAFTGGLLAFAWTEGPLALLRFYVAPYLVFVVWVDLVTLLHHTDPQVPWYRAPAWSPLRGALSTVDRRYGVFEPIHHDAGCHVAHHLFPAIPHYRLRAATAALRPLLGSWYREEKLPVWRAFRRARRDCALAPRSGARVLPEPAHLAGVASAGPRPATKW